MYFDNVTDLESAKKEFRRWCMALHPDRGGNAAAFVAMQKEYITTLERLEKGWQVYRQRNGVRNGSPWRFD